MRKIIITALIICLALTSVQSLADTELIAMGSKGDIVVRIQQRLMDLGYYTYKPTGSYQAVTRSAVVDFQVKAGVMSDGTVGEQSINLLFSKTAPKKDFSPIIPLSYRAQSGDVLHRGKGVEWNEVATLLIPNTRYVLTNCYSNESCEVLFVGGANHAEMIPVAQKDKTTIDSWIGNFNSYYKCAVTVNVDGKEIAASIQWGSQNLCVYFLNSRSHVNGMVDIEHDQIIERVLD